MENIICLDVTNLPYKKIKGFLKNHKINQDNIALKVEISQDFTRYTPLTHWENHLPFSHRVTKIILLKIKSVYLFVGHSTDNENIIYNPGFSKLLLESGFNLVLVVKLLESDKPELKKRTYFQKRRISRLDQLLDKIRRFGINSLDDVEKKDLDALSKK